MKALVECGTNGGYRRHLSLWEEACAPCCAAHAAYERGRYAAAPAAPRQLVPCGQASAWRRHIRRDEKPCGPCVLAHRADVARYAPRRRGAA